MVAGGTHAVATGHIQGAQRLGNTVIALVCAELRNAALWKVSTLVPVRSVLSAGGVLLALSRRW